MGQGPTGLAVNAGEDCFGQVFAHPLLHFSFSLFLGDDPI